MIIVLADKSFQIKDEWLAEYIASFVEVVIETAKKEGKSASQAMTERLIAIREQLQEN